jgi:hypothetical protein
MRSPGTDSNPGFLAYEATLLINTYQRSVVQFYSGACDLSSIVSEGTPMDD